MISAPFEKYVLMEFCLVDDRGRSTCALGHYDSTSPTGLLATPQDDLRQNS